MKIKEFLITRYGPLHQRNKVFLHNFNLFFGKNESGKTLTIDALIKLLLGQNIKDFEPMEREPIDRVDENPEGYVIIEDDIGKEIKLPEKGLLTEVIKGAGDLNLTPSDCRNVFIVRSSDLSISSEDKFYTNVTDRLIGLKTKEISEIKEILREKGKITPKGILQDVAGEKLKTRVENAKKLIEEIKSLWKEIKEKKFDELEEEFIRQKREKEKVEEEIKNLDDARKREKYEKGKEALENLKKSLNELKGLKIYKEEDKQLWRDCEKEVEFFEEERKTIFKELKEKERELTQVGEELNKKERDFNVIDARKKEINDRIKPELKNYESGVEKVKSEEMKNKFYIVTAVISAVLLSTSVLGIIINPLPIFYGLAILSLMSTIVFLGLSFSFVRKRAYFNAIFEKIRLDCAKFELDAESLKEIYLKIQKFDEEYQKTHNELQEIKRRKSNLDDEIKRLQEKETEVEKKIKSAKDRIDSIKEKSGENSLEGYIAKIELKRNLEKQVGEQESLLKSHFGRERGKAEENIPYWDEEIRKLEEYKDKAQGIKFDESRKRKLEDEMGKLEKKLEELKRGMKSLQDKMKEMERKTSEILQAKEKYLYCETSDDLKAIKDKLQGFVDEIESNKDDALEAIRIFEEIETEEKEKVSTLFGREKPVSKYFSEITDGLYEEVTFD